MMAAAMLAPALVDAAQNNEDWAVFVGASLATFIAASLALVATKGAQQRFSARLGFALTISLWLTGIALGMLPFLLSPLPLDPSQALFEATSAITTTGVTVLVGLDALPAGILLWRSILCWIGGIGFIALGLLLLPSLRVGGVLFFQMESSQTSEKVLPRLGQIAKAIVGAYCSLTMLCALSYLLAGMSGFDALNHALTTVSTAGFSTHDASLGYFHDRPAIFFIAIIFMILSALPFVLYIKLFTAPGSKKRLLDPQVILFAALLLLGTCTIALFLHVARAIPLTDAFTTSLFHVTSIATTTGFVAQDYSHWGDFPLSLFFLAFFIGGCAGSTSGGIKLNRVIVLWRLMRANMNHLLSPRLVARVRYRGVEITDAMTQTVLLFLCLYMGSLVMGSALLTITGLDFVTAFSAALTALSNVGPGFGTSIGPVGNFSAINDAALWILSFLMLTGRLELITVFILFMPAFWRG